MLGQSQIAKGGEGCEVRNKPPRQPHSHKCPRWSTLRWAIPCQEKRARRALQTVTTTFSSNRSARWQHSTGSRQRQRCRLAVLRPLQSERIERQMRERTLSLAPRLVKQPALIPAVIFHLRLLTSLPLLPKSQHGKSRASFDPRSWVEGSILQVISDSIYQPFSREIHGLRHRLCGTSGLQQLLR